MEDVPSESGALTEWEQDELPPTSESLAGKKRKRKKTVTSDEEAEEVTQAEQGSEGAQEEKEEAALPTLANIEQRCKLECSMGSVAFWNNQVWWVHQLPYNDIEDKQPVEVWIAIRLLPVCHPLPHLYQQLEVGNTTDWATNFRPGEVRLKEVGIKKLLDSGSSVFVVPFQSPIDLKEFDSSKWSPTLLDFCKSAGWEKKKNALNLHATG